MNNFKEWINEVNRLTDIRLGLSIYDLPEVDFDNAFRRGLDPHAVIEEEIMVLGENAQSKIFIR